MNTSRFRIAFLLLLLASIACAQLATGPGPTDMPSGAGITPVPKSGQTDTRPPARITPTPLAFELVGNAIQVLFYTEENKTAIAIGNSEQAQVVLKPIVLKVARRSDGSIQATSQTPWNSPTVTEMQMCFALDKPCQLTDQWTLFVPKITQEVRVDWSGPREYWLTIKFRDAAGTIIPAVNSGSASLPQQESQSVIRITGIYDTRTPMAALPSPVLTALAATRMAFPLSGSVVIEGGRCCAGGQAGSTISITAAFTATSPLAEVKEMRTVDRYGGGCLKENDMASVPWEPFAPSKIFSVRPAINWIGFYVSVQYHDAMGNLSPVYCDDISVEGSPPPPSTP
jgi:hypothetical protein